MIRISNKYITIVGSRFIENKLLRYDSNRVSVTIFIRFNNKLKHIIKYI